MRVKIWGARGSFPTPLAPEVLQHQTHTLLDEFVQAGATQSVDVSSFLKNQPRYRHGGYGGNTLCIEVTSSQQQLIIDAGSGIRALGYELMQGPCGRGQGEIHLLFTHFHWDHLIGLPFFAPIFIPGNKIHVYAVQPELKTVFRTVFKRPYFPVALESLGAQVIYHHLQPRVPVSFGEIQVTPYQLDHPDPCWGYRMESEGKVYSHCVDTECTRVTREELGPDLPLYQGVDLMVFDAQYTLMENIEKVNWGHATASLGLDLAMREGIKKVIFIHHDPISTDEKIAAAEAEARRYYKALSHRARITQPHLHEVEWSFGYEGMAVDL